MEIEKRIVERPFKKLIRQAEIEHRDTGDMREQKTIKADGSIVVEKVPVIQRVFHEPVFENAVLQQEIHVVKAGKKEEHHFASEEDARRFINDTEKDVAARGGFK